MNDPQGCHDVTTRSRLQAGEILPRRWCMAARWSASFRQTGCTGRPAARVVTLAAPGPPGERAAGDSPTPCRYWMKPSCGQLSAGGPARQSVCLHRRWRLERGPISCRCHLAGQAWTVRVRTILAAVRWAVWTSIRTQFGRERLPPRGWCRLPRCPPVVSERVSTA